VEIGMQAIVLAVVAIQLAGCFPRARKMPLVPLLRSVTDCQGRRAIYFELVI